MVVRCIGLRQVELITDKNEAGSRFALKVNGREIFCRGANWVPADALPSRITPSGERDLRQSAVDANMNMLRVWGGGFDSGRLGKIMSGTAHVLGPGMESWHPNPDFFFAPGGGPILDMGPYYVNNLVNLVGPVKRVVALANRAREERVIGNGPRLGEKVPVVVATNIHAILEFVSGAQVALMASWDVWAHRHQNMELYGTDGAVFVPDPNFFGGKVEVAGDDKEPKEVEVWDHPLAAQNFQFEWGKQANYRGIGLADMMEAVTTGRDYRCSLDRSLHTIDVLTAILRSAEEGRAIDIVTTCTQPEALGIEEARALLR